MGDYYSCDVYACALRATTNIEKDHAFDVRKYLFDGEGYFLVFVIDVANQFRDRFLFQMVVQGRLFCESESHCINACYKVVF